MSGERISDFMDYPEDYRRMIVKPMFPMAMPPIPVPFPMSTIYQPEDPSAGYLSFGKKKKKSKKEKDRRSEN